jgi:LruC domain-containing protein
MKRKLLVYAAAALSAAACSMPQDPSAGGQADKSVMELSIPAHFSFETTVSVTVEAFFAAPDGAGLQGLPVTLSYITPDGEQNILGRFAAGNDGMLRTTLELPATVTRLVAKTSYPGLPDSTLLSVSDGMATTVPLTPTTGGKSNLAAVAAVGGFTQNGYTFQGSFNAAGVPDYLEPEREKIDQALLNDINASLPETRPVPQWHPEYLSGATNLDTRLTDLCDVWITFVHEGAGWVNTLGYYTYDVNNPPKSASEVAAMNVIFPNVSFTGSGGGLTSGDQVYLGRFPAGTGIGWFLLPNAWDGGKATVKPVSSLTQGIKYSNSAFNTYAAEAYRQHFIALKDESRELILLGFEDTTRPGGDNDFNDAIFYVSANPYTAVDTEDILPVEIARDSDGDGVFDHADNYPDDKERAYDQFFPGNGKYGSLAFEDLWPAMGDYDFNDLVVDYNYHLVTDAANRVKDVNGTWITKAVGGRHRNALAFQLNVDAQAIQSVSGQKLFGGMVKRASNGTEAGQSKAVVFVYDDAYRLMTPPAGFKLVNAEPGAPAVAPVQTKVQVTLNEAVNTSALGAVPFNPFLVSNQRRGVEIHLPNQLPTDLADTGLFKTQDDRSVPGASTYKTATGLPWAVHLPAAFAHPYENQQITQAYLRFAEWAESGGTRYTDWYVSKTGYRNTALIWK